MMVRFGLSGLSLSLKPKSDYKVCNNSLAADTQVGWEILCNMRVEELPIAALVVYAAQEVCRT
jgi:hypothetical protein